MTIRPHRARGVIVGALLTSWAGLVAFVALQVAWGAPTEWKTFLAWVVAFASAALAVLFLVWTLSLASLAYELSDDVLTIRWGLRRVIIPLDSVQRLIPGRTLDEPTIEGLNWWGCHIGHAEVPRVGYVLFFSTHSTPEQLLYVVTDAECYGLTIQDQAAFAEAIESLRAIAPVGEVSHRAVATGMAAMPFWRDRAALAWAGMLLASAGAAAGYVFFRYPSLPDVVRLPFPDSGGLVRVGSKEELLRIAYLAVGIGAGNAVLGALVHARERASGLWLLAGGTMLESVLAAASVLAIERI